MAKAVFFIVLSMQTLDFSVRCCMSKEVFVTVCTRFSSNDNFYVKYSCLSKLNNSFLTTGPRIWKLMLNNIPCDLRHLPKNTFKTTLHKVLISILVKEGGYVDVATLINTLKNKLN